MTIETLDVFRGRVESMTNPRARRGFLESFYSEFKNEGIFTEDVEGIEKAASLLNKYGFSTHAKKLIAHPAYSQADFIDKNYGELPPQSRKNVLKTMVKYGTNQWWNSQDPVEIAQYQLFEDILMVDFSIFHEGVEKLLDRPVWTHEFGLNNEGLKRETKLAIEVF